ncbi:MAG: flavodoxin family protein, partial [Oscillospiraceae bacterium]|nr:flavodoxin family protein [Oscillospiraceae bacterium]
MKILFINGSPNPDGATAAILSVIREAAEMKAHDCRTVCLGEQNIHFCIGCKVCYETGVCCQRDDMDKLHAAMEKADCIVMGLPSYWGDMPGHAKVFIDRTTPYCDTNAGHSTFSDGKVGYAVAVRAGPTARESDHLIASVEHF